MYTDLFRQINVYWKEYGGWLGFLSSPFVHISAIFTALYAAGYLPIDWHTLAITALPTLLGFSLAAYTITFTLMGSALHRALSAAIDNKSGISLIRTVNSTFFHVVIIQSLALLFSILNKGTLIPEIILAMPLIHTAKINAISFVVSLGNITGFFLVIYSMFLLASIAIGMFRLGRLTPPAPFPANESQTNPLVVEPDPIQQTKRFKAVIFIGKLLGLSKQG
ncbi:hypothetical protein MNQ96_13575 [Sphingopyxis granuli]|uniref:hypothetical protein n=1 Tax=Sphingopyxis granuli TaxID=267128 RepID=UPI001F532E88|nr:hypothetical protein [Sphingopyxis granuli]UNK78579.1 hypothetical protein MNQ96_13575 [Sphingopyxis granuli]